MWKLYILQMINICDILNIGDNMIQTISTVDKKFLSEIEDFMVNPRIKKRLQTGWILCLAGTIVTAYIRNIFLAIIFFAATVTLFINFINLKKNAKNAAYKAIEKEDYSYIIKFDEDIHIRNVTTGQESNIPAYEIAYLLEKEEYFVLFTRKWQYIPVYKEKLEDVEEFKKYLKEQAPCMKIKQEK